MNKTLESVMQEFNLPPDPEELESVLQDYRDVAKQHSDLIMKYEHATKPVKKGESWFCPECGKRTQYNHTHCHWCGKKLGWR